LDLLHLDDFISRLPLTAAQRGWNKFSDFPAGYDLCVPWLILAPLLFMASRQHPVLAHRCAHNNYLCCGWQCFGRSWLRHHHWPVCSGLRNILTGLTTGTDAGWRDLAGYVDLVPGSQPY
jgi:hypothetical protein